MADRTLWGWGAPLSGHAVLGIHTRAVGQCPHPSFTNQGKDHNTCPPPPVEWNIPTEVDECTQARQQLLQVGLGPASMLCMQGRCV